MASNVSLMNNVTALQELIDGMKDELVLTNQRAKDATITQYEVWHIGHAAHLRRQIAELEKDLTASKNFG